MEEFRAKLRDTDQHDDIAVFQAPHLGADLVPLDFLFRRCMWLLSTPTGQVRPAREGPAIREGGDEPAGGLRRGRQAAALRLHAPRPSTRLDFIIFHIDFISI